MPFTAIYVAHTTLNSPRVGSCIVSLYTQNHMFLSVLVFSWCCTVNKQVEKYCVLNGRIAGRNYFPLIYGYSKAVLNYIIDLHNCLNAHVEVISVAILNECNFGV